MTFLKKVTIDLLVQNSVTETTLVPLAYTGEPSQRSSPKQLLTFHISNIFLTLKRSNILKQKTLDVLKRK